MPQGISASDFYYILPEIVITAGALLVLIADVALPRSRRGVLSWLTMGVIAATMVSLTPFTDTRVEVANGLIAVDGFALFFKILFLLAAAITVLMVLNLVEPQSSGIGGGWFLLNYDAAGQKIEVIDGRETAPVAVRDTVFLDDNGKPQDFFATLQGGQSVGVPGVVAALWLAHQRHGRLP